MQRADQTQLPLDPHADLNGLALYYSGWCPYCKRVLRVIEELQLEDRVLLRDVDRDPEHDRELRAARGRGTVPVLRVKHAGGERWMPESRDIVAFLRARYGEGP
jgi:glutathione S-transferase